MSDRAVPHAAVPLTYDELMGELRAQAEWSECRPSLFHLCDRDGAEVDLVLESGDGRVVGVEVEGKPWIRTEVSSATQVEMSPVAASSGSGLFHRSGDCSRLIKRKR